MLSGILIALHVFVALVLIVVVLLQSGKGAGIGAGFGGSSQTLFGSRGPASFLSKFTTAAAIIFMLTSLTLSVVSSKVGGTSIVDSIPAKEASPAAPAPAASADPFKAVHEAQEKGMPAQQKGQTEPGKQP
ncbi:MAG: preprotein translocase subunit SecG [Nitrospinae bacterium]|nr:preprotein translocase subunit SecG [Nitrospinota bacterium]